MSAPVPLRLVPRTPLPGANAAAPPLDISFGRFELQVLERRLLIDGAPAPLQARALDLLIALAENAGKLMSRRALMDRVWGDRVVEEGNLTVQINALRRQLGNSVIATVPGFGYRFQAETACRMPALRRAIPSYTRTSLPAAGPALIGRGEELAALAAAFQVHALVSIVGAGGVGKTRLAQTLLQSRRSFHEHGVCLVDLSLVDAPAGVPATVAAALGMRLAVSGDAVTALAQSLAPLDILLALDNAEHLLDAVAAVAGALLSAAPGVRLLITSQAPLRVVGEQIFRLGALAVPAPDAPLKVMLAHGAVALFIARATAADRRFAAHAGNVPAIAELCHRLDGNALAIELAAARLHMLGLPSLLASLEGRLGVLTAGRAGAPERQRTLRAALDWSHGLLDRTERTVFRRLSVFVGSAPLDTLLAVVVDAVTAPESAKPAEPTAEPAPVGLDDWAVLDALGHLVDRSLVEVVEPAAVSGEPPAPRYRLLDTPRVYAREHLIGADEIGVLQRRHMAAMCTRMTHSYQALVQGTIGHDEWQTAMSADIDNARAAMQCALAHGDAETALRLATVLSTLLDTHRQAETRALWAAADALLDPPARAKDVPVDVLAGAALACGAGAMVHNKQHALMRTRQALDWFEAADDPQGRYRAMCQAGWILGMGGRADELRQVVEDALELHDEAWPPYVRALGACGPQYWLCVLDEDHAGALHFDTVRVHLKQAAGWQDTATEIHRMVLQVVAGQIDEAIAAGRALVARLSTSRRQGTRCQAMIALIDALLRKSLAAEAREVQAQAWPLATALGLQTTMVDHAAWLAALEGRPRAALRLLGHADATLTAAADPRSYLDQADRVRTESMARARLDADPGGTTADRLFAEGRALGQAALTALALGDDDG